MEEELGFLRTLLSDQFSSSQLPKSLILTLPLSSNNWHLLRQSGLLVNSTRAFSACRRVVVSVVSYSCLHRISSWARLWKRDAHEFSGSNKKTSRGYLWDEPIKFLIFLQPSKNLLSTCLNNFYKQSSINSTCRNVLALIIKLDDGCGQSMTLTTSTIKKYIKTHTDLNTALLR